MTKFNTVIAIAVGSLFAGAAFAQSNHEIEQRDRMQQQRIERGVQSGQITSREADRLLGERAQIERLESRARSDGVLTRNERARIDHRQDRLSRDIYRESHDRQVANPDGRRSDRGNDWGRRNDMSPRQFDRNGRSDQFNHRAEGRGERNEWRGNAVTPRTGSDTRFGRSDMAPGRQPHLQQSAAQRTQVQQAQTQRSWTRPARTSAPMTTASTETAARHGGRSGRTTN